MLRDVQIMGCADMPECADMPLLSLGRSEVNILTIRLLLMHHTTVTDAKGNMMNK